MTNIACYRVNIAGLTLPEVRDMVQAYLHYHLTEVEGREWETMFLDTLTAAGRSDGLVEGSFVWTARVRFEGARFRFSPFQGVLSACEDGLFDLTIQPA